MSDISLRVRLHEPDYVKQEHLLNDVGCIPALQSIKYSTALMIPLPLWKIVSLGKKLW